jgi:nucleotide-binding universal stress UspA family protein
MPETVLVPIDGSEASEAALDHALDQFTDVHLIIYHSVDILDIATCNQSSVFDVESGEDRIEQAREGAERLLADVEQRASDTANEIELDAEVGSPADNIARYAKRRDVDHIVIGSHGRTGLRRITLGSIAEKVVRRSPAPVTIIHPDTEG